MIKYELAKQLKDAGFPQGNNMTLDRYMKSDGDIADVVYLMGEHFAEEKTTVYIPTLSELIEACGDDFLKVEKMTSDSWWATCTNKFNERNKNIRGSGSMIGKTPEEAAANLWLVLNKK